MQPMLVNTFLRLFHGSVFSEADSKDGANLIRHKTKSTYYMAVSFKLKRTVMTRCAKHRSVVNIMYSLLPHLFVRRIGNSVNHKLTFPGHFFFSQSWNVQYFLKRDRHAIKWFVALMQPIFTEHFLCQVLFTRDTVVNTEPWTFGAQKST